MSFLSGFEHFVREGEPLAPLTWFRVGGPAQYFAEPTNLDELAELIKRCRENEVPLRLLGGGSNLLVRDEGVAGMVLHLAAPAFGKIEVEGETITAGGGAKLGHLLSTACREGLAGLETLAGIPGTVGGALHGNASSHAGDIGAWTDQATVLTRSGEVHTRERSDMLFAYRQSSLDELAIVSARFKLEREDPQELTKKMQKLWIVQRAAQPTTDENAGFIFKDVQGYAAAEIIDQAGLKGESVGGASVSQRNANFIVAQPGTKAAEVLELIEKMQSQVNQRLGLELDRNLEIW